MVQCNENGSMKKLKKPGKTETIILGLVLITLFFLFFHLFKFERNEELYTNIEPGKTQREKISVLKVGQSFTIDPTIENPGFNKILLLIAKAGKRKATADFTLKTGKGGKILVSKKITLRRKPTAYPLKTILFARQELKHNTHFYFEIRSSTPFYVYTAKPGENVSTRSPGTFIDDRPGSNSLAFGLYLEEKISILTYLLNRSSGKKQVTGMILILLSLLSLTTAGFFFLIVSAPVIKEARGPIPGPVKVRINHRILIFLGLFVFFFILTGFIIGNNTYAKLQGSQDDEFISYKYARNLAEGQGFRFNPDEKVLGTTTPLYTLLLSFFGLFFQDLHIVSLVINLISLLMSGMMINVILSRHFSPGWGLIGGVLFICFPMFYQIMGMETNFLILLVILSVFLFSEQRYYLSFFFTGLAVLTRIESSLLVLIFVLSLLLKKEYRKILKATGLFLLTLLPWFVFAYFYFGKILPNTFYVKTAVGYTGQTIFHKILFITGNILKLTFLKSVFLKGFLDPLPNLVQNYWAWVLLFLIGLAASLKYLFKISFLRFYLSWVLLYVFSFAVLNVPLFIWYYVLALSVIPVVLAVGLYSFSTLIPKPVKRKKLAVYCCLILFFGVVVLGGRGIFDLFCSQWYAKHIPHLERFETYLEISKYIAQNIPKEKSIAMEEIGILGYSLENKIWDFYCLVHDARQFPHYFPAESPYRIPYLLSLMDPDYVLVNSFRLDNPVFLNWQEIKIFKVKEFNENTGFYYSLLKKNPQRLQVLGDIDVKNKLSGTVTLRGWVFGSESIASVELLVNNEIISQTSTFHPGSPGFRKQFAFNRRSKKAVFYIKFDSSQLENGFYELVFRARTGLKTGVFRQANAAIEN